MPATAPLFREAAKVPKNRPSPAANPLFELFMFCPPVALFAGVLILPAPEVLLVGEEPPEMLAIPLIMPPEKLPEGALEELAEEPPKGLLSELLEEPPKLVPDELADEPLKGVLELLPEEPKLFVR